MKGLSLQQPWATLVALGAKRIETRSWPTSYRGELLIHASKVFRREDQALSHREPFADALIAGGYDRAEQLPLGRIVAVATLDAVVPTEAMDESVWPERMGLQMYREQAFGDFSPRRYAWLLSNLHRLPMPLPAAHVGRDGSTRPGGALGLWSVPQVLLDLVAGQGVL